MKHQTANYKGRTDAEEGVEGDMKRKRLTFFASHSFTVPSREVVANLVDFG
jgi:hypothetical protein